MKLVLPMMLMMIASAPLVCAQGPTKHTIAELKVKTVAAAAPKQCLLAFREFFNYLQKNEPSIVKDDRAQKLFLSENLRKAFQQKIASFANGSDDPDFPGNGTFIGSWDYPTTYSIVSSRRYGERAIIDVLYKWGPNTNYPGDERTMSFIYVFENRMWKLDDIYTFRGEFAIAESLNQYLLDKR
ncbi:MAG TPA: hypothetical protein VFT08_05460 [Pyrinomonadaceae bacterium]|nr:hypothetical protein [Pyrinomonadaceae bacterium]